MAVNKSSQVRTRPIFRFHDENSFSTFVLLSKLAYDACELRNTLYYLTTSRGYNGNADYLLRVLNFTDYLLSGPNDAPFGRHAPVHFCLRAYPGF